MGGRFLWLVEQSTAGEQCVGIAWVALGVNALHACRQADRLLACALRDVGVPARVLAVSELGCLDDGAGGGMGACPETCSVPVHRATSLLDGLAAVGPRVDAIVAADVMHTVDEVHAIHLVSALLSKDPRVLVLVAGSEGEGRQRCASRGATGACGAFTTEKPSSWWVQVVDRGQSHGVDAASTVALRNALFDKLDIVSGAYWWPKNALVFARRGFGSKRGVPDAISWFRAETDLSLDVAAMFARDAVAYRDVLERESVVVREPEAQGTTFAAADSAGADGAPPRLTLRVIRDKDTGLHRPAAAAEHKRDARAVQPPEGGPPEIPRELNWAVRGGAFSHPMPTSQLLSLYLGQKHDELHAALLGNLGFVSVEQPTQRHELDDFLTTFFFLVSRPDFNVVRVRARAWWRHRQGRCDSICGLQVIDGFMYLKHVARISQMVRVSDFGSTDIFVRMLSGNDRALIQVRCMCGAPGASWAVQMLLLYTPYNRLRVPAAQLWPHRAQFADAWCASCCFVCVPISPIVAYPQVFRSVDNGARGVNVKRCVLHKHANAHD